MTSPRIGRFAPTPSGLLHFGSLVAAVASFVDARACGGQWLLRMEDIDPPREVPGAKHAILATLEHYGFEWQGPVLYQSERHAVYQAVVDRWLQQGLAYACTCSRKALEAFGGVYPGLCRNAGHSPEGAAIRLRVPELRYSVQDRLQGRFEQHLGQDVGDFIIRRRDGLYAYQLAVVVDDGAQGVTDVVRGADLLDSTPRQLYLQELLGLPAPSYLHVPLLVQPDGHKLGKRYRSAPLNAADARAQLLRALRTLGQAPTADLAQAMPRDILAWGIANWDLAALPRARTLAEAELR
jgi:glutamyl-Q tRNA(Asp) synthetase